MHRLPRTLLLLALVGCRDPAGRRAPPVGETGAAGGDSAVGPDTGGPADSGASPAATGRLLVTEVLASNQGSLAGPEGDTPDWIELYNPGPETVDLDGWTLSDDPDEPGRGVLPAHTLVPGAFAVVWATGEEDATGLAVPFKLSAEGDTVLLHEPDGALADRVDFGPQRADVSWGRPQGVVETVLAGPGTAARALADPAGDWTAAGFDDGAWAAVVLPVGFDRAPEGGGPDLALFAETTQSSDGYGRTGAQAVDGELSTFSHTADADLAPWWRVDLGETVDISSLQLLNRVGCCPERLYNIRVEVEDEGGAVVWASDTLNPVAEGHAPSDPGVRLDPGLDATVRGRFVRVRKEAVGGARSSEWLSLAEVQVAGTLPAPYALWIETEDETLFAGGRAGVRVALPPAAHPVDQLTVDLLADDGARLWLDGVRAGEENVGADAVPVEVEAATSLALDPALLGPDGGLLAAEVEDLDGEDALLGLTVTARSIDTRGDERAFFSTPTPGAPNGEGWAGIVSTPTVDPPRGFFDAPFSATVRVDTPGAVLVTTVDGSLPTLDHGARVDGDETGATARLDITTTTTLRARAFAEGWGESDPVTHTWLFLGDVVQQAAAPPGVPAVWDGLAQAPVDGDYEMDPEVTLDAAYTADLLTGLRAIPTLSLVLDPEDLWGADTGIYIHSTQRGAAWERPASAELLRGDGTTGFAETCGVRIHGYGWRPHSNTKKHSLRLEFRREYGASKLDYPLFPDAPVGRFDSIVLRAQGSRGWQDFRDPEQAQYIRDAFARDTALAMGKADGHAAYVHLYLNGLYWGLYMAVERPDADFAAERYGGEADEYDAVNRRTTTNEAIDGDLEAYDRLLALADADLADDANAAAVEAMVDVDDLIDYMLIHQYTTNRDGPEQFQHNNMRGTRRRRDGEQFRFYVWDMEYSLWNATDDLNIDVDVPGSASHVYARLRANAGFRARYAERARQHLTAGGALTPAASLARWEARATEIEDAVVAESARWGDTDRAVPYTRDVEWAAERRRLTEEYFPARTAVLIEQLRDAGLYTE